MVVLLESLALDQLCGQEVPTLVGFHRVNGDDIRVIERRDGLGLALESLAPLGRER